MDVDFFENLPTVNILSGVGQIVYKENFVPFGCFIGLDINCLLRVLCWLILEIL